MNAYEHAVDDELIVAHLGVTVPGDDYETARKKLQQLIDWHITVATDPRVNGGYRLVKVEEDEPCK